MIEGVFYIESQGNNERVVKSSIKDLVEKLKGEKGVFVKKSALGDTAKDGDNFAASLEVEASFESLKEYFMVCMRYVPYAIVLDSPRKLKLNAQEFLKILGELTAITARFQKKQGVVASLSQVPGSEFDFESLDEGVFEEDEIEAFQDQKALRVKLVVQMKAGVEESKRMLLESFGNDIFVHKLKASRLEDNTLVALHAFMYEPKTLVWLCIKLSPVYIEILEPMELELSLLEIQDMGIELAALYFEMAHIRLYKGLPS